MPNTSISVPVTQLAAQRFEQHAQRLHLPVSMVLGCALEEVVRHIGDGWRPQSIPPAGRTFLYLSFSRARKNELDELAEASGLKFLDVARVATWAALVQMEAAKFQVAWPLMFTKKELNAAVDKSITE